MRDTTWFYNRKWGVSVHYLAQSVNTPGHPGNMERGRTDWSECVAELDTQRLAEDLASVGAGYLIFTMVQVTRFLAAPNGTFDRISGYRPGEACSTVDVVEKLYASLSKHGIDLLLYFPCDGPSTDPIARAHFGGVHYGRPGQVNRGFVERWSSVIEEYSLRYGSKVKGWWLDGCYYNLGYTDELLGIIANACRAGNPEALVSSNLHGLVDNSSAIVDTVRMGCPSDDFTFGELWGFYDIPQGPYMGHCRWHMWSSLNYKRRSGLDDMPYTADYMLDYVRRVNTGGGVVTMDAGIFRDGHLNENHLAMMARLKELNSF